MSEATQAVGQAGGDEDDLVGEVPGRDHRVAVGGEGLRGQGAALHGCVTAWERCLA